MPWRYVSWRHLTTRPAVGPAAVWAAWFIGLALLLTTWALAIGRYGGPDEPAHVVRAYAVAHGDLRGAPTGEFTSGYRIVSVPVGLGSGDPACYRFDPTATDECAAASSDHGATTDVAVDPKLDTVKVATAAGINSPLYYGLVGFPVRLLLPADDVISYRIIAALWVAAVLALTAVRLRRHGRRALVALAVAPPSAWFLFGVVNPNALEIALVGLAWACVVPPARRADWVGAGLALGVAVALRPVAVVAAVVVVAVGCLLARANSIPVGRTNIAAVAAPSALGLGWIALWHRWADVVISDPRTATDRGTLDALFASLGGLPRTAAELVAALGWLEFWVPLGAAVGWAVIVTVIVARSRPRGAALLVWAGGLIATPVLFEVVAANDVGLIWQGRYSLPIALGIGALVIAASGEWNAPRLMVPTVAVIEVITFWWTVRRYDVGINGQLWPSGDAAVLIGTHLLVVVIATVLCRAPASSPSDCVSGSSRTRRR